VLPVSAAFAVIMIIFAAVAAPGWFARDKPGLESPALPEDLLGVLTLVVIPVQILLIIVAMVGFNHQWSVEEERPIGAGPPPEPPPPTGGTGEHAVRPRPDEPAGPTNPGTTTAYIDGDADDWADGSQPNPAV
jgi:hypothetical protein